MRSRSSKHGKEVEKPRHKEEPHLSGAYIRSLVKQLTSSKTKEPINPKAPIGEKNGEHPNPTTSGEGFNQNQAQQSQSTQPKKQVRRRLHTSRPYQERLLNMAEARREIVTALKFHRAAMKQANEQRQQQEASPQHTQAPPCLEPLEKMKSRKNPGIYPPNDTSFTNYDYLNNFSYSSFSPPPPPLSWASPPMAPLPINDNFNLPLPNQPLGLNLNFHEFSNMGAAFCHSTHNPSIYLPSSLSPSSSSSSPSMPAEAPAAANALSPAGGDMHHAMDDEEMAEIRMIGEQHEMEWNDKVNLVTSAWWFKFMKAMEIRPESRNEEWGDDDGFPLFDEAMEIPAWLTDGGGVGNAPDSGCGLLQQHLDDLPCLDIGEIEAMDGDWLS